MAKEAQRASRTRTAQSRKKLADGADFAIVAAGYVG